MLLPEGADGRSGFGLRGNEGGWWGVGEVYEARDGEGARRMVVVVVEHTFAHIPEASVKHNKASVRDLWMQGRKASLPPT